MKIAEQNKREIELLVMYEEDSREGNVVAYIPALRLGAIGEDIEEARQNALDLIHEEINEKKMKLCQNPTFEKLQFSVSGMSL